MDSSTQNASEPKIASRQLASARTVLSVKNLRTSIVYEHRTIPVIDGISFDLKCGEVLGILGESGAGKSVLCRSLLRILDEEGPLSIVRNEGSSVSLDGVELLDANEETLRSIRGNKLAMIFQEPLSALNPYLSIETQLTEALIYSRKMPKTFAVEKAIQMLEKVGIENPQERIKQFPHQFSGGMRQRVLIAMVLLMEPDVIIADEPSSSLDTKVRTQIVRLVQKLQSELSVGMIWVSHDLQLLGSVSNRLAVMYGGRIVEYAPSATILNSPQHPYTKALLECMPSPETASPDLLPSILGQSPSLMNRPPACAFHPRCPQAMPECSKSFPEVRHHTPEHWSACFLNGQKP